MNIDGTQSKKLLEEARGTILAVDYDPVESKVGDQAHDVNKVMIECIIAI